MAIRILPACEKDIYKPNLSVEMMPRSDIEFLRQDNIKVDGATDLAPASVERLDVAQFPDPKSTET